LLHKFTKLFLYEYESTKPLQRTKVSGMPAEVTLQVKKKRVVIGFDWRQIPDSSFREKLHSILNRALSKL